MDQHLCLSIYFWFPQRKWSDFWIHGWIYNGFVVEQATVFATTFILVYSSTTTYIARLLNRYSLAKAIDFAFYFWKLVTCFFSKCSDFAFLSFSESNDTSRIIPGNGSTWTSGFRVQKGLMFVSRKQMRN